jgi:hypothetical protein
MRSQLEGRYPPGALHSAGAGGRTGSALRIRFVGVCGGLSGNEWRDGNIIADWLIKLLYHAMILPDFDRDFQGLLDPLVNSQKGP